MSFVSAEIDIIERKNLTNYLKTATKMVLQKVIVIKHWNWEKFKLVGEEFLILHSKNRIPQNQTLRQVKIYISLFSFHHLEYAFTTNSISSLQLELHKTRSKVQEKDMSREHA